MLSFSLSLSFRIFSSFPESFAYWRTWVFLVQELRDRDIPYIDVTFFHATPETLTLDLDAPKIFTYLSLVPILR